MPTHAEAEPLPEGVGTVNLAETALKVVPAGGAVKTAPAQLELYDTLVSLSRARPSVVPVAGILGCVARTRSERRSTRCAMPAKAVLKRRALLKAMREYFMVG